MRLKASFFVPQVCGLGVVGLGTFGMAGPAFGGLWEQGGDGLSQVLRGKKKSIHARNVLDLLSAMQAVKREFLSYML